MCYGLSVKLCSFMLSDAEYTDIWGEFCLELAWDRIFLSQIHRDKGEGVREKQFHIEVRSGWGQILASVSALRSN
jgi:hypothetical protein